MQYARVVTPETRITFNYLLIVTYPSKASEQGILARLSTMQTCVYYR